MQKAKQTYRKEDTKKRYDIIIGKLQATVTTHSKAFPQLTAIDAYMDSTFTDVYSDEDCLEKLKDLCLYFHELSIDCYVFRHLYHNLSADVEAAKNNTAVLHQEDSYIILPK